MADQTPVTGHKLIDHWAAVAQGGGRPTTEEMITVLDEAIALRRGAARAYVSMSGDSAINDWQRWGRETYVLEYILGRLQSWKGKK